MSAVNVIEIDEVDEISAEQAAKNTEKALDDIRALIEQVSKADAHDDDVQWIYETARADGFDENEDKFWNSRHMDKAIRMLCEERYTCMEY